MKKILGGETNLLSSQDRDCIFLEYSAPVKLFCSHRPRAPPGKLPFLWLPVLLITLFLPFPALINHFSSDSGLSKKMGLKNLTGA